MKIKINNQNKIRNKFKMIKNKIQCKKIKKWENHLLKKIKLKMNLKVLWEKQIHLFRKTKNTIKIKQTFDLLLSNKI